MKNSEVKVSLAFTLALVCGVIVADEASFIRAYDAENYDEAARQIEGLDTTKPDVARRLGVMYYSAKGVPGDQGKGRDLLEQAMMSGDALAAINLAKIYCKFEKDLPKAAWCRMVAETLGGASVKDDVERIRKELGDESQKGVVTYVGQLRSALLSEREANKRNAKLLSDAQAASKKSLEELDTAKKKLSASEEKCRETNRRLAASESRVKKLETEIDGSKKSCAGQTELKKELAQAKKSIVFRDKEIASLKWEFASANQKIEQLQKELSETKESTSERDQQYNELVDEYNDLQKKYNDLKTVKWDESVAWPGRGLNTLLSAPCNFVRTVPAVREVYNDTVAVSNVGDALFVSFISIPVLFCAEAIPTVCDIGNGLMDVITLGTYGDWLYSGAVEARWDRRDNSHFPWLNRK